MSVVKAIVIVAVVEVGTFGAAWLTFEVRQWARHRRHARGTWKWWEDAGWTGDAQEAPPVP